MNVTLRQTTATRMQCALTLKDRLTAFVDWDIVEMEEAVSVRMTLLLFDKY